MDCRTEEVLAEEKNAGGDSAAEADQTMDKREAAYIGLVDADKAFHTVNNWKIMFVIP